MGLFAFATINLFCIKDIILTFLYSFGFTFDMAYGGLSVFLILLIVFALCA
jgi:hypothetical protein